jgi:hypothetical protein
MEDMRRKRIKKSGIIERAKSGIGEIPGYRINMVNETTREKRFLYQKVHGEKLKKKNIVNN